MIETIQPVQSVPGINENSHEKQKKSKDEFITVFRKAMKKNDPIQTQESQRVKADENEASDTPNCQQNQPPSEDVFVDDMENSVIPMQNYLDNPALWKYQEKAAVENIPLKPQIESITGNEIPIQIVTQPNDSQGQSSIFEHGLFMGNISMPNTEINPDMVQCIEDIQPIAATNGKETPLHNPLTQLTEPAVSPSNNTESTSNNTEMPEKPRVSVDKPVETIQEQSVHTLLSSEKIVLNKEDDGVHLLKKDNLTVFNEDKAYQGNVNNSIFYKPENPNSNLNTESYSWDIENISLSTENMNKVEETMIKSLQTLTEGSSTVMKVQLHPKELGKVSVELTMEDGKIAAKIFVENSHVKQLFNEKYQEINQSFKQQNIQLSQLEIDMHFNGQGSNGSETSDLKSSYPTHIFDLESSIQTTMGEPVDTLSKVSILA
ncbi:MAG: flagellar hook-length control protein FliK [Eubacteriales bacterium]